MLACFYDLPWACYMLYCVHYIFIFAVAAGSNLALAFCDRNS